ncbi:MAG: leucine-rich repeat domain-containing protein, partial [Bacilli bacterium]
YSEVEGGVSITGYNIEGGLNVVIPSMINGKKVVAIADYAFTINGITPPSIKSKEKASVSYLNNSKNKTVIPLAPVRPDILGLGITSVIIPSTVKSIGRSAFFDNKLTEVTIPSSVTIIGHDAFYGNKLTKLTIPGSVTSIGESAFENNQLTEIIIPSSVTSIGRRAFYKDSSSNSNLSKIVNKSSKSFAWTVIVNDEFGVSSFITGTVKNSYGNVEVVSE